MSRQDSTTGRRWTRDETLVALNLYCRLPFGQLHARNPTIQRVAEALDRTPASVAMKCCNLASLDPTHQQRGVRGLQKASAMDREVWGAFESDRESIAFESELALSHVLHDKPREAPTVEWENVDGLDRFALTRVRVNQRFFREMILASYREQCAVCRLPIRELLVASHIVPWSRAPEHRMNPRNGLCLCNLHDRAFDTHLLHITPDYRIRLSPTITAHATQSSIQHNFLVYDGQTITLPDRWLPDVELLIHHNA